MLGRMDSSSCDEIDGCVLDSIDNGEGTIIDGSNDGENEGSVLRDLDGGPLRSQWVLLMHTQSGTCSLVVTT